MDGDEWGADGSVGGLDNETRTLSAYKLIGCLLARIKELKMGSPCIGVLVLPGESRIGRYRSDCAAARPGTTFAGTCMSSAGGAVKRVESWGGERVFWPSSYPRLPSPTLIHLPASPVHDHRSAADLSRNKKV